MREHMVARYLSSCRETKTGESVQMHKLTRVLAACNAQSTGVNED